MSLPSVLSVAATDATLHTVAADVYTVSIGRIGAIVSALIGLLGSVGGALALARTTGRGRVLTWTRRNGSVTALLAGSLAVAIGAAVAATAEGGLGTGNGLGGAYVAILLGLAAVLLGGLARSRTRPGTGTGTGTA
ncbi:DUF6223 family protein [Streptomyces erythrochromogenes]|uniref:DUF6223 family protein n=1 Tax=Streptomyces yangpuensis TaxID=1648182 RepID=UPI003412F06B|nr:DUF6223 family protein [Streptomyces erythrochromogenes]